MLDQDADGAIFRDTTSSGGYGGVAYVVRRSNQIKSAIGNSGQFDPTNPDIRFSRRQNTIASGQLPQIDPADQSPWQRQWAKVDTLTAPDALDNILYEMQDKLVDLKRLREHIDEIGGAISDLNDAYTGEELFHKRLAKRVKDYATDELRPLLADMRARGLDLPTLERYLHARHAPEANAAMAARNPNQAMIDAGLAKAEQDVKALQRALQRAHAQGTATKAINQALTAADEELTRWKSAEAFDGTEEDRLSLSGMSDADAAKFMNELKPGQRQHLEALAARVDAMTAETLNVMERYGLMDKKSINDIRAAYQYYVPLHRDDAHPHLAGLFPMGGGMGTIKRRTGSNQQVTNILAHIDAQRRNAIRRGEENRVAKKLYLMASQNPDPEIWTVDKAPTRKVVDKTTGLVRTEVDPTYRQAPNVILLRIGGKDHMVTFNEHNPRLLRLAISLKNLDMGQADVAINTTHDVATRFKDGLMNAGVTLTRFVAQMSTQYNLIWGLWNFKRDVGTGLLRLTATPLAGKQADVVKYIGPAVTAIYAEERARRRGEAKGDSEMVKIWHEMQDAGGTTGFRELFLAPQEEMNNVLDELATMERGVAKRAFWGMMDWVSDTNEVLENAVRLAAYRVARENGMSNEQSASLSKNLTVNFNRKGRTGAKIARWFAFFNAGVQGLVNMIETLRGPAGKHIVVGGVMLGMLNAALGLAMFGDSDDDEENGWYRIPENVRERNLILPAPWNPDGYVALAVPLGYNVIMRLGQRIVETIHRPPENVGAEAADVLRLIVDGFNPLGGSTNPVQMLVPTIGDLPVALLQNRDWRNRPIYLEDFSLKDPSPGFDRVMGAASAPSRLITEALNKATGGTDYQPGAINWTPDQIDYVFGFLTGGVGRELLRLEQTLTAPFTGEELQPHQVPLLGRLYGNVRGSRATITRYNTNLLRLNAVERELEGRARDGKDDQAYIDSEPLTRLIDMSNQAERELGELRRERRDILRGDAPDRVERARAISEKMNAIMKLVNDEVYRARNKPETAAR